MSTPLLFFPFPLPTHPAQNHFADASSTTASSIGGSWHSWCQAPSQPSQKTIWFASGLTSRVHRLQSASPGVRFPRRRGVPASIAAGLYVAGFVTCRPDLVVVSGVGGDAEPRRPSVPEDDSEADRRRLRLVLAGADAGFAAGFFGGVGRSAGGGLGLAAFLPVRPSVTLRMALMVAGLAGNLERYDAGTGVVGICIVMLVLIVIVERRRRLVSSYAGELMPAGGIRGAGKIGTGKLAVRFGLTVVVGNVVGVWVVPPDFIRFKIICVAAENCGMYAFDDTDPVGDGFSPPSPLEGIGVDISMTAKVRMLSQHCSLCRMTWGDR
jgi:hypothetical protein